MHLEVQIQVAFRNKGNCKLQHRPGLHLWAVATPFRAASAPKGNRITIADLVHIFEMAS